MAEGDGRPGVAGIRALQGAFRRCWTRFPEGRRIPPVVVVEPPPSSRSFRALAHLSAQDLNLQRLTSLET